MSDGPPALLPAYRFTLSECCVMWSHVETEIELVVVQRGARVEVAITITNHCDPWGDHRDWEWTARLRLQGAVRGVPGAPTVQIVVEAPAVVDTMTFDPAQPHFDSWYEFLDEPTTPLPDFWHALVAWGWKHHAGNGEV
jgi:hypothetical protein